MTIPGALDAISVQWRKSTYSGGSNNCVEIAQAGAIRAVRDSKNPEAGFLTFDAKTWRGFITAVKRGTYDL